MVMQRSVIQAVGLAAVAAAALAGCGQPAEGSAAATAERLATAVAVGDGAAACAVLAPDTVEELEQSAGTPCPKAIGEEELPPPGAVESVDVYGQWARVVTSGDT